MKNLLILTILMSSTFIAFTQNTGSFYVRYNSDKDNSIKNPATINADDVYRISFGMDVNPKQIDEYDLILLEVQRGNQTKGEFEITPEKIRAYAGPSEEVSGNIILYPKIVEYKTDPISGNGNFYLPVHQQKMGGNYFLSRKGHDYSSHEEVDSYSLKVGVYGFKIVSYKTVYENGSAKQVPQYGPATTIIAPVKSTVKTSAKIPPMEKSHTVRDKDELKSIFGEDNPFVKKEEN